MIKTYLLASIEELVSPLLREILLGEEALGTIQVILGLILMFLRDPIREIVLRSYQKDSKAMRNVNIP